MRNAVATIVKLVVAEYAYVIAQSIQHTFFDLTSEQRKEQTALHCVAGVDKQHIRLIGTHAVYKHLTTCYSAETVFFERVYLRVCVVGMQHY